MSKHINIRVHGRVQGVLYRQSACHLADSLGLKGIISNEPDGTVYIEVEGEQPDLEKFVAWCQKGPPAAVVSKVEQSLGSWKGFANFSQS